MQTELIHASPLPSAPVTRQPGPIVYDEQTWFGQPADIGPARGVSASRWSGYASTAQEETTTIDPDCHVLGVALRPMDVTVFAAQRLIHQGLLPQGTMRVNEPGLTVRTIFRGGFDVLHIRIRNAVIAECLEAGGGPCADDALPLVASQPSVDPVIERLANALIHADDFGGTFGRCYADGVGLAIVARLLARNAKTEPTAGGGRVSTLPKWRLKRATDYIAAHLGEPIGLTDIAASAGLTRMHFAAQFRAATGLRPHEYLLRRRIERAQELLAASDLALVEIALEVGFKAQAHFTTVFARIVGQTPNVWRRNNSTFCRAA